MKNNTFKNLCIILLFSILTLIITNKTKADPDHSVPNGGSPYFNFSDLKEGEILHIPTGIKVTKEQMLDDISASKVIYIAETHDNFESHRIQLEIIKALNIKFPGKIAVGMEMLRRPSQPKVNQWINQKLTDKEFLHVWYDNWGEGYPNYQDILNYIKEQKLPLVALKPDKKLEFALRSKGIENLSKEEKSSLPEMDQNDIYHKTFAESVFGGHGKSTHAVLKKPYNTLLLWEETMAESVSDFLKSAQGKDKKLIVLTGSFHVEYGFGIPKRAFRRVPHNYSIILPKVTEIPDNLKGEVMMDVKPTSIPLYIGDYAWNVSYQKVKETGVKLGVSIKPEKDVLKIINVQKNSNASSAGIQNGDIIISMDKKTVKTIYDLKILLHTKKIGDKSVLEVMRDKNKLSIDLVFKY